MIIVIQKHSPVIIKIEHQLNLICFPQKLTIDTYICKQLNFCAHLKQLLLVWPWEIFDGAGSVEYSNFWWRDGADFPTEKGRKRFCDGKGPTDINQKVQIMEVGTRRKMETWS